MTKEELKDRTKKFALLIINIVDQLPNTITGRTISNQIIRSGTSVAANYRSACRARSNADFEVDISKSDFLFFLFDFFSGCHSGIGCFCYSVRAYLAAP